MYLKGTCHYFTSVKKFRTIKFHSVWNILKVTDISLFGILSIPGLCSMLSEDHHICERLLIEGMITYKNLTMHHLFELIS